MTTACRETTQPPRRDHSRKGFTLTEIAIVLGIIGLILGAIWVAASAVYNNLRVSKTTTQLLQVTQAVRAMYATTSTVDPSANMAVGAVGAGTFPATYAQAGVFPSDMVISATAPTVQDVWGGAAGVTATTTTAANDSFAVIFTGVPTAACISLLTGNTGSGRDVNMVGASATAPGGGTPGTTALPVLSGAAQGECGGASRTKSDVVFTFLK